MNEDKATRYHRLKRRASILSLLWSVLLLAGLAWTGASVWLGRAASATAARLVPAGWSEGVAVFVYVVLLSLLHEAGSLPLGFQGGFLLERRYGLSTESLGAWALDQAKALGLGIVLGGGLASVLYAIIRVAPGRWWLPAGLLCSALIVGLANVAPLVLLPLFYSIKPIARDALGARLVTLASRAGARVLGVYEWGLGDKTRKANAALTGLGSSRRILISDTMLASYSDDEIEVVLAHELAHHVHGDIWRGIALESALVLAGFWLAARALAVVVEPLGLSGPADPAGLPVLLLAAGAVSLLAVPASHALSRAYERRADRFALELTKNPGAFVSAMKRLGAQNLAEEDPSRLVQWLFHSHPPMAERIAAAQAFKC